MWGDDDQRWTEARIIFVDTEPSNWTCDPERQQYYWHRFFHHQPDLNYDNPEVQEAMLDVVRFWLDLGLDGFRLDAVPYLFERRRHQRREPARDPRLPAPPPQGGRRPSTPAGCCWPRPTSGPRTSSSTSATGDECHMCFHFPLMPRMFMAVRREERHPIAEILAQHAPRSPTAASGASSCATTTS